MAEAQSQAFLVTAATGSQSGAVARALLAAHQRVHALVRDPSKAAAQRLSAAGAKIFKGDFDDTSAITAAASGCTGVFINVLATADRDTELNHAQNIISAALSAGVTKCVYTSVINAEKYATFRSSNPDGTYQAFNPDTVSALENEWLTTFRAAYWLSKAAIQEAVSSAGFTATTILQPGFLLSNLIAPVSRGYFPELAAPPHVLRTAYTPSTKIPITDPADIAKFAAKAFLGPAGERGWSGRVVPVVCHETPTIEDIARVMGEVGGRAVQAEYLSDDEFWQQRGWKPMVASQGWMRDGWFVVDAQALRDVGMDGEGGWGGTLKGFLERERAALEAAFDDG